VYVRQSVVVYRKAVLCDDRFWPKAARYFFGFLAA
jgi:hypothetical protein